MARHRVVLTGMRCALVALLTLVVLPLSAATPYASSEAPGAAAPFAVVQLPPEALTWHGQVGLQARASRNPKLDSALADVAESAGVSLASALDVARSIGLRLDGERVHVQVSTHAEGQKAATQAVIESGGEVTKSSPDGTLLQGWLPVSALDAVAACPDVYLVRRPNEGYLLEEPQVGARTTEALSVMNATAWHSAGYRGAGVKVGIVDMGYVGYASLLGTDLPASVTVHNFVDGESTAQVAVTTKHGTACAEIIHDVAPNAALYLARISTDLDLVEAVHWLMNTAHVDIISSSMGWWNLTPGDGTGFFADLVIEARNAGILWVTSAGNSRLEHWGGAFNGLNGSDWHYYDAQQNINFFGPGDGSAYWIPAGYPIRVALRWNDWSYVNQDFDLYLVRWDGSDWQVVAGAENDQTGAAGQSPTELAGYVTAGGDTAYGFAIYRRSATRAVNLEVFAPNMVGLDQRLYARSLANLADAPAALTVAALDVVSPYDQESYSSQGPTNGPGGTATGGITKPDIAGFANVATVSYGTTDPFNGTSSACPHVAGAAAVVLSAYPAYTPGQLRAFLQDRAVDMGPVGVDNRFGYGRLYLGNPVVPTPTATIGPGTSPWDAAADFTLTHGAESWYYQYLDGGTFRSMVSDGAKWTVPDAPNCGLVAWGGTPSTYPVVRKWVSPITGWVRVTGTAAKENTSCGDGVTATVRKNAVVLWSKDLGYADGTGYSFDLTVSVAPGDALYFILAQRSTDACDATFFHPYINQVTAPTATRTPTRTLTPTRTRTPTRTPTGGAPRALFLPLLRR